LANFYNSINSNIILPKNISLWIKNFKEERRYFYFVSKVNKSYWAKQQSQCRGLGACSGVEHLPNMCKALGWIPNTELKTEKRRRKRRRRRRGKRGLEPEMEATDWQVLLCFKRIQELPEMILQSQKERTKNSQISCAQSLVSASH
jgi:hypothetical protein